MRMPPRLLPRSRRFNTASGMDCMQLWYFLPQIIFLLKFQYRKRYGLHAISRDLRDIRFPSLFQYRKRYGLHAIVQLSFSHGVCCYSFQYRKRYGLHAILSPEALGNSEPKRWFSNTPSLFALFPKPQGIFLSQKAAQKGCEASNAKETFIHEENLKPMAISRKSRTSL